ncbi:hypothetical protein ECDEC13C_1841 [Escherichia coli DEC13C]|nr:hypothetical protein ECDEC13C_1841 [Escherichia coli DEC13C]EHX75627.1 hypothetical protein ECDEC13E_1759 [Escherichia coli DEC13E]
MHGSIEYHGNNDFSANISVITDIIKTLRMIIARLLLA